MANYFNCYDWDYADHPQKAVLDVRCRRLAISLKSHPKRFDRYAFDLNVGHKYMFRQFVPLQCKYIAGNFRAPKPLHLAVNVGVGGDPDVGSKFGRVRGEMLDLQKRLRGTVAHFDVLFAKCQTVDQSSRCLKQLVAAVAIFLERLLTIHPYVNGNGHMGRMLALAILGRYGYSPQTWSLNDRPPYVKELMEHRRKNVAPLQRLILSDIIG